MSLRITRHGVDVGDISFPERNMQVNSQASGNETTVDISGLGPMGGYPVIKVDVSADGQNGSVEVPLQAYPQDRKRGWAELSTGQSHILAYQLFNDSGDDSLILLKTPGTADWMSQIDDNTFFGDLTICGSHESAALHGMFISKCQELDIGAQLEGGVRVLDIRLKWKDNDLQTYHGIRPEYSTLRQELDRINAFLQAHPRETVLFSIKEEAPHEAPFAKAVYDTLKSYGDRFVFSETVPRLGELRGKGWVWTRFGREDDAPYPEGLGFHPTIWPDSQRDGFEWDCSGTMCRIHDWYGVDSALEIGGKTQSVITHLSPTLDQAPGQFLNISFTSASKFPATTPQWMAKGVGFPSFGLGAEGVNSRMVKWLLEQARDGKRPKAVLMVDYFNYTGSGQTGLGGLLSALNFIGR